MSQTKLAQKTHDPGCKVGSFLQKTNKNNKKVQSLINSMLKVETEKENWGKK